jgi:hypothetical protein
MQPVGVGERHEGARVVRPQIDDALIERAGDLGAIAIRLRGGDESVGVGIGGSRSKAATAPATAALAEPASEADGEIILES